MLTLAASQYAERESASKAWPFMATGVLVYMFVTAIPFLSQPVWLSSGWHGAANWGFHHVMPILYALFWILFVPKGSLVPRHGLLWMIVPFCYGGYLLLHGPCYALLDVTSLGIGRVAGNIVLGTIMFLAVGEALVLIDRVLTPSGRRERANREGVMSALPEPALRAL